jgi:hypothetical protein
MSVDSPSEPSSHHDPDSVPADPGAGAADVRAMAAEVWRRVNEWRNSPGWRDDDTNRRRYDATAQALGALDALPDQPDPDGAGAIVKAAQPISEAWRPNRAGPEQAIYAAVDRLRDALRRLAESGSADA